MNLTTASRILCALFFIAGTLSIYVSVVNAEWFFKLDDVKLFTGRMPRTAARVFYGLIGVAILTMAVIIILSV